MLGALLLARESGVLGQSDAVLEGVEDGEGVENVLTLLVGMNTGGGHADPLDGIRLNLLGGVIEVEHLVANVVLDLNHDVICIKV